MLKWTSNNKLPERDITFATPTVAQTPRCRSTRRSIDRKRRATISLSELQSNKENIITSTPAIMSTARPANRNKNILSPYLDSPLSLHQAESKKENIFLNESGRAVLTTRQSSFCTQGYASTLPRFEEEYSPNTLMIPGQFLAMRGLLPDTFLANKRYLNTTPKTPDVFDAISKKDKNLCSEFETPQHTGSIICSSSNTNNENKQESKQNSSKILSRCDSILKSNRLRKSLLLPQKRKLESEFDDIADESRRKTMVNGDGNNTNNITITNVSVGSNGCNAKMNSTPGFTRNKDILMDRLMGAITESKKKLRKTTRKSMNLRRRTLLSHPSFSNRFDADVSLSPSYTPAEDPASDLSFSECKRIKLNDDSIVNNNNNNNNSSKNHNNVRLENNLSNDMNHKETVNSIRKCTLSKLANVVLPATQNSYIEVGLALPSIYV